MSLALFLYKSTAFLHFASLVVIPKEGGTLLGQWLQRSEFKPEDPGFDLLAGQGEGQCFGLSESTRAYLFVLDPPLCARNAPQLRAR